jgi:hypothetical protein
VSGEAPPGGATGFVEGIFETHVKVEVLGIARDSVTLRVGTTPIVLETGQSVDVVAHLPFRNETGPAGGEAQ